MGAVWSARHVVTKRAVAIKFLKPPASLDLVQRFVREAQAANAVRHPNVVEVHDFFELDSGLPAMVMDLFDGDTLACQLERRGVLGLPELARIMLPIVSALSAIHAAGIVHRDLKPENIFLAQLPGDRIEPMVLDFGICKLDGHEVALANSDASTTAGRIIGSPCYMAPEQVRGAADIDGRTDIWALGVIFYECVTGVRPFDGDNVAHVVARITLGPLQPVEELAPHLPADFARLINRMLLRDRKERLSDLDQVRAVLQSLADKPSFAAMETPPPFAQRAPRPLVTAPRQPNVREAETVAARGRVTTMSSGSVSAGIGAAKVTQRALPHYVGPTVVGVALIAALLVLTSGRKHDPVTRLPAAQSSSVASVAIGSSPPRQLPALTVSSATPAASSEIKTPRTLKPVERQRPRRIQKTPVTDFGGRR